MNGLKSKDSLSALKGMQSVRATFTLPKNTINLLSAVANQLGVKQKSIFDHLVEDKSILDQAADEVQNFEFKGKQRRQKTFVLSRHSLETFDHISRTYKLPRDLLVAYSIQQLKPVIDAEKEKHENRKTLLRDMKGFMEEGRRLENRAGRLLGGDDQTVQKLQSVLDLYQKQIRELELTIEKGKCMERVE